MGGRVSEEFQALTDLGEDIILYDEKNNIGLNKEVLEFDDRETFIKAFAVSNIENLKEYPSLELGNNFELGTKYSDSMHLYFTDENGEEKLYKELLNNNISAIIDDRANLSLGNRINDVYVLGTPKMIILGN